MAGIEKITKEIELEAEKEAAEIIAAAEKAAEDARSKVEQECRDFSNTANGRIDKKLEAEAKKIQSQCEQVEKLKMLETKQGIIDGILAKAKDKIISESDDKYFDVLLKLLEKQVQSGDGEILLSQKDTARVPADFETKAATIAADKGGKLSLSTKTADIDGGFVLKYGNIEINSSIDALFEENNEILVDTVNTILW